MVEYNNIKKILEYTVKCYTRSTVEEKLSELSSNEKYAVLSGLLNKGQLNEYKDMVKRLDEAMTTIKQLQDKGVSEDNILYQISKDRIPYLTEKIYDYEKKIVLGYEPVLHDVPSVNMSKYTIDTNGDIEEEQIKKQQKTLKVNIKDTMSFCQWSGGLHEQINNSIYNNNKWNDLDHQTQDNYNKRINPIKKSLTRMINRGEPLDRDMTFYHGGRFNINLNPGDHMKWKGYLSMSYDKQQAERFKGQDYLYICLTPKGSKGLCANDPRLMAIHQNEREYLRGRNTGGTIISVDYDKKEVIMLMD